MSFSLATDMEAAFRALPVRNRKQVSYIDARWYQGGFGMTNVILNNQRLLIELDSSRQEGRLVYYGTMIPALSPDGMELFLKEDPVALESDGKSKKRFIMYKDSTGKFVDTHGMQIESSPFPEPATLQIPTIQAMRNITRNQQTGGPGLPISTTSRSGEPGEGMLGLNSNIINQNDAGLRDVRKRMRTLSNLDGPTEAKNIIRDIDNDRKYTESELRQYRQVMQAKGRIGDKGKDDINGPIQTPVQMGWGALVGFTNSYKRMRDNYFSSHTEVDSRNWYTSVENYMSNVVLMGARGTINSVNYVHNNGIGSGPLARARLKKGCSNFARTYTMVETVKYIPAAMKEYIPTDMYKKVIEPIVTMFTREVLRDYIGSFDIVNRLSYSMDLFMQFTVGCALIHTANKVTGNKINMSMISSSSWWALFIPTLTCFIRWAMEFAFEHKLSDYVLSDMISWILRKVAELVEWGIMEGMGKVMLLDSFVENIFFPVIHAILAKIRDTPAFVQKETSNYKVRMNTHVIHQGQQNIFYQALNGDFNGIAEVIKTLGWETMTRVLERLTIELVWYMLGYQQSHQKVLPCSGTLQQELKDYYSLSGNKTYAGITQQRVDDIVKCMQLNKDVYKIEGPAYDNRVKAEEYAKAQYEKKQEIWLGDEPTVKIGVDMQTLSEDPVRTSLEKRIKTIHILIPRGEILRGGNVERVPISQEWWYTTPSYPEPKTSRAGQLLREMGFEQQVTGPKSKRNVQQEIRVERAKLKEFIESNIELNSKLFRLVPMPPYQYRDALKVARGLAWQMVMGTVGIKAYAGWLAFVYMLPYIKGWADKRFPQEMSSTPGLVVDGAIAAGTVIAGLGTGIIDFSTTTYAVIFLGLNNMVASWTGGEFEKVHAMQEWKVTTLAFLATAVFSKCDPNEVISSKKALTIMSAMAAYSRASFKVKRREIISNRTSGFSIEVQNVNDEKTQAHVALTQKYMADLDLLRGWIAKVKTHQAENKIQLDVFRTQKEEYEKTIEKNKNDINNLIEEQTTRRDENFDYAGRFEELRLIIEANQRTYSEIKVMFDGFEESNETITSSLRILEQQEKLMTDMYTVKNDMEKTAQVLARMTYDDYVKNVCYFMSLTAAQFKIVFPKEDPGYESVQQFTGDGLDLTLTNSELKVNEQNELEAFKKARNDLTGADVSRMVNESLKGVVGSVALGVFGFFDDVLLPWRWTPMLSIHQEPTQAEMDGHLRKYLTTEFILEFMFTNFASSCNDGDLKTHLTKVQHILSDEDHAVINMDQLQRWFRSMVRDARTLGWWSHAHRLRPQFHIQSMLLYLVAMFFSSRYNRNGKYAWNPTFVRSHGVAMSTSDGPHVQWNVYSMFLLYPDHAIPLELSTSEKDDDKSHWSKWGNQAIFNNDPEFYAKVVGAASSPLPPPPPLQEVAPGQNTGRKKRQATASTTGTTVTIKVTADGKKQKITTN